MSARILRIGSYVLAAGLLSVPLVSFGAAELLPFSDTLLGALGSLLAADATVPIPAVLVGLPLALALTVLVRGALTALPVDIVLAAFSRPAAVLSTRQYAAGLLGVSVPFPVVGVDS